MKKISVFVVLLLMASMVGAMQHSVIDPEDLSLKAGPTEPGEELSLVWVEALVYPKVVDDARIISLGVKLTAPVKGVAATFDFNDDKIVLISHDGMSWSGAYEIPDGVSAGLHVVRYAITASKGSIQRTLNFFMEESKSVVQIKNNVTEGEVLETRGWPLTVSSTCAALVGGSSRILYLGQNVVGLSKVPWYKVIFEDGEEGWVPASMVKEPLNEYYELGYEAYLSEEYAAAVEHYKDCVAINPEFVKGHFWLAKSYYRLDNLDGSYRAIKEAMRLDERDIDSKVFANNLAHKFFASAHRKFKAGRHHEAIADYQKVLELKPSSVASWIEMGQSYAKLGFPVEARLAWREALKVNPENKHVYALLKIKFDPNALASVPQSPEDVNKLAKPAEEIPPLIADDSLKILKGHKTGKGTKIEAALKSVLTLTKSLGTPVIEKGWEIKKKGEKFLVAYVCEQGKGILETFEWQVDVDSKRVTASNANARLLMTRW